jgi:trk system potassium uptake protein
MPGSPSRVYCPGSEAEMGETALSRWFSTPRLIVYGFLALMALGTVLLKLPVSTQAGISWANAFFVSVSCGSVTGLSTVTVPTTFTPFGQVVIMVLVQLGGLGIMTVTTIAALLVGQRVGFRSLLAVREEMDNVDSLRNTFRLLGQIAAITFAVEIVGAVVLGAAFLRRGMGAAESAFQGLFHSIMAFCNAGFTILPGKGLLPYAGDWLVVGPLVVVITLGGLGFPVLVSLYRYTGQRRLSVHAKLVLISSGVLVVAGVMSVGFMEWTNPATLGGETISTRAAMSVFQGVTPRTAGFATVDYAQMREPTLFVQTLLMFIGTAPTSTGGGVKVTTVALVFLIVASQVRGQDRITLFWRELPRALVAKALAVLALSTVLIVVGTLAIMISDGLALLPALFEITSAFGTTGLSMDVTPDLSAFGKILVAATMFLGRVGPITFVIAMTARQRPPKYTYPQEDIAIG